MSFRNALRFLLLALAFVAGSTANAQLFRAYVASDGSDANPCTLPSPCRLLPAALNAVASGGEIWMLDSANFNSGPVAITKSVTILAIPGAVGSVVATGGGDALLINSQGIRVTLRNLVLVHLTSSLNGLNFAQGAELNLTDCDIANMQGAAISATAPGGKVAVRNSVLRGSANGILAVGSLSIAVDGSQFRGNTTAALFGSATSATIANSSITGNDVGIYTQTFGNGANVTSRLAIERSVLAHNGTAIRIHSFSSGDTLHFSLSQSVVTMNTVAAMRLGEAAGSTNIAVLDGNVITKNAIAFSFADPGTELLSRGNNSVRLNGSDIVGGGAITALAGM